MKAMDERVKAHLQKADPDFPTVQVLSNRNPHLPGSLGRTILTEYTDELSSARQTQRYC